MLELDNIALLDQCWVQGCIAGLDDLDEVANPYPYGTKESQYWNDGWWTVSFDLAADIEDAAEEDDLPIVKH